MKRTNPIYAYKRLLANDHDWDYAYLIALEKKKLQRMHDCIKCEGHLENNALVVRELAICIRLIDIFMEDDAVHNTWLHRSYSGTRLKFRKREDGLYELDDEDRQPIADYPVYVNIRNEQRFFRSTPIKDAQTEGNRRRSHLRQVLLKTPRSLTIHSASLQNANSSLKQRNPM